MKNESFRLPFFVGSVSQLYFSRDVDIRVIQQKDYEGWRNDREVNTSANP